MVMAADRDAFQLLLEATDEAVCTKQPIKDFNPFAPASPASSRPTRCST